MMNLETLTKIGGQEWEKGTLHRVYFNDLSGLLGIQTTRYNTGNIASATRYGEKISNSQAHKVLSGLALAKVWYDVPTQQFQGREINKADFDDIVAEIRRRASSTEATAQEPAHVG